MSSGQEKILEYLIRNRGKWISNQELRRISGLDDAPRAIRLLRQKGWEIHVRGDGFNLLQSPEKGEGRGERKTISEKTRYEILARDNFRCKACGLSADDGIRLEVDHMTPVDWGGTNDKANLITLCDKCNRGKKAWLNSVPSNNMKTIMNNTTVEARIESLFDNFPNQDIPSSLIQIVSKGAFDWQRALRRIRKRTGKNIVPTKDRRGYRYFKD